MTDSSAYFIEMLNRMTDIKINPLFQAEINATPACLALFTTSGNYLTDLMMYQLKLEMSSKPFTVAGIDIRIVAATDFSITASVMSSYGISINNTELKGLKAYTYTKLYREKVVDLLTDCNYILDLITANAAGLVAYKIDAPYTANLQALADQILSVTKLPKAIKMQHANDNLQFKTLEKKAMKFFDYEMDTFMEIYRKTDMDLFLAYTAARQVRHHHLKRKPKPVDPETTTGILELLLLLKDTMEPAVGANFLALPLNISEITDAEGETYNDELAPGTYQGILHLDGYKVINFEFTIVAGQTTALQFLLEKEDAIPVPPMP